MSVESTAQEALELARTRFAVPSTVAFVRIGQRRVAHDLAQIWLSWAQAPKGTGKPVVGRRSSCRGIPMAM